MEQQGKKKDNGGYLYKNDKKQSAKSPDWRGKVTWKGEELLISGWIDAAKGGDMISLALTDPSTLPPKGSPAGSGSSQGVSQPPAQGGHSSFAKPAPAAPAAQAVPANSSKDDSFDDLDDLERMFNSND